LKQTTTHCSTRATGMIYEAQAAEYLEASGYRILERNFRCRMGEIDIIASDNNVLIFIEVKYRGTGTSGGPEAAVTPEKQRTICKVALYYMHRHCAYLDTACRFDVIAINSSGKIHHLINAYDYVC